MDTPAPMNKIKAILDNIFYKKNRYAKNAARPMAMVANRFRVRMPAAVAAIAETR